MSPLFFCFFLFFGFTTCEGQGHGTMFKNHDCDCVVCHCQGSEQTQNSIIQRVTTEHLNRAHTRPCYHTLTQQFSKTHEGFDKNDQKFSYNKNSKCLDCWTTLKIGVRGWLDGWVGWWSVLFSDSVVTLTLNESHQNKCEQAQLNRGYHHVLLDQSLFSSVTESTNTVVSTKARTAPFPTNICHHLLKCCVHYLVYANNNQWQFEGWSGKTQTHKNPAFILTLLWPQNKVMVTQTVIEQVIVNTGFNQKGLKTLAGKTADLRPLSHRTYTDHHIHLCEVSCWSQKLVYISLLWGSLCAKEMLTALTKPQRWDHSLRTQK